MLDQKHHYEAKTARLILILVYIGIMLYLSIQASRARKGIDEKSGEIVQENAACFQAYNGIHRRIWQRQFQIASDLGHSRVETCPVRKFSRS